MNGTAGAMIGMGRVPGNPGSSFSGVAEETVKSAAGLAQGLVALRDRLSLVLRPGVGRDEAKLAGGVPVQCQVHGAFQEVQNQLRDGHLALQEILERLWL